MDVYVTMKSVWSFHSNKFCENHDIIDQPTSVSSFLIF